MHKQQEVQFWVNLNQIQKHLTDLEGICITSKKKKEKCHSGLDSGKSGPLRVDLLCQTPTREELALGRAQHSALREKNEEGGAGH